MLLVAVPLQKSWLGLSYWRTPSIMELPVELEYIPYEEFEERFSRLNQIARPIYPTIWPNIFMVLIFGALIVTAAVGMARNQTGLAVMGQVACFVIPILAILWIRVRKEGKARARKQFKKQSIKLLREWTEQDSTAFAIQWKLRLRVWNDVRRRREAAIAAAAGLDRTQELEQEQGQEQEVDVMREQLPLQQQSVAVQVESVDGNNNGTDTQTTTTIQRPPRIADVYTALQLPTPAIYITPDTSDNIPASTTMTTPSRSRMRAPPQQQQQEANSTQSTSDPPRTLLEASRRSWIERLRDLSSRILFTETRVWMIEISRRDGAMDEYALTVPSPVYCGYRLPGYEDVLLAQQQDHAQEIIGGVGGDAMVIASGVRLSPSTTAVNSVSQQQQSRYGGPPPAYFSDSEGEDGEDDDDEEERVQSATIIPAASGSNGGNGGSSELVESSTGRMTTSGTLQHQRPMEMTTVTLSSGPTIPSATPNARIGGHLGRFGNHLRQQQGSTMSGSTMTMSSSCSAATSRTTLALTLADQDKDADEDVVGDEDVTPSADKGGTK
ncbi:hypothetical protein BGZ91_003885 [Linnemannia elongata]|nr:hypothetical protein BGZ91_003885 [Linnemannia elongata]